MHSIAQETFAQIFLWGSLGCLPLGILLFIFGFRTSQTWKALLAFVIGGAVLTQFCWYFKYLGASLGHVAGDFHPPLWQSSIPIGFGVAIGLAFFSCLCRKEYKDGIF